MVLPAAALDPPLLLETVQEERCTAVCATPGVFSALLAYPAITRYDLSSLRVHTLWRSPAADAGQRKEDGRAKADLPDPPSR
jgi:fatty-acyl-CoA synthase